MKYYRLRVLLTVFIFISVQHLNLFRLVQDGLLKKLLCTVIVILFISADFI